MGLYADDIRIVNANVVTMDDENPTADTLLIGGNRIVSVGADAADGADQAESTDGGITVIDARGAVVIPGLIDQHLHWNRSAITWGYALHRGENAFTLQDLEAAIRARTAEVPEGEWIALIGRHNHLQFLEDPDDPLSGRYPTRQELDEWAPGPRGPVLPEVHADSRGRRSGRLQPRHLHRPGTDELQRHRLLQRSVACRAAGRRNPR